MPDLVTKDDETDSSAKQRSLWGFFPLAVFQHCFILSLCNLFWFISLLITHAGHIVVVIFNYEHLKYSTQLFMKGYWSLNIIGTKKFAKQTHLHFSYWKARNYFLVGDTEIMIEIIFLSLRTSWTDVVFHSDCGSLSVVGMEKAYR